MYFFLETSTRAPKVTFLVCQILLFQNFLAIVADVPPFICRLAYFCSENFDTRAKLIHHIVTVSLVDEINAKHVASETIRVFIVFYSVVSTFSTKIMMHYTSKVLEIEFKINWAIQCRRT